MRYIQKGDAPKFFEDWKQNFKNTYGKEPSYNDLKGEEYHKLKTHIIDEQFGLCCYCCKRVEAYNSHIEHFRPQSRYPEHDLLYSNMLVSCNGYKDKNENCGHKKNNWYSEYYTVSPVDNNCESYFVYTLDGHIKPNHQDSRAQETIKNLDLDSYLLKRARETAIYISGIFDEDIDKNNKRKELITLYTTPKDCKLYSFCIAITYCLSSY